MTLTDFIARQKWKFQRGQIYVSMLNTIMLVFLLMKADYPIWIIASSVMGLAVFVWFVGHLDVNRNIQAAEFKYTTQLNPPMDGMVADVKELLKRTEVTINAKV